MANISSCLRMVRRFRPVLFRKRNEFRRRLGFKVLEFDFPHWVVLWSNMGRGVRGALEKRTRKGRSAGQSKVSAGELQT